MKVAHLLSMVDDDGWQKVKLNIWEWHIRATAHEGTSLQVR